MGKNGQKYGMHGVCTWCVSARRTPARCPHKPHPDCLISSFLTAGLTFHVNSTNELFAQCGGFFRDWITNKPSLWRACVSSCIIVHYNLWTMEKKVHEHFRSTGSPAVYLSDVNRFAYFWPPKGLDTCCGSAAWVWGRPFFDRRRPVSTPKGSFDKGLSK